MPELNDRLREAREALGLGQQVLAERCGVTARSQRNYESGERLPDAAYLAALDAAGADVLYVLTGHRNGSAPAKLDAAEQVLLDSYRRCNAQAKQNLIQTAALLSAGLTAARVKEKPEAGQSAYGSGMNNSGANAVQVGHGAHFSTGSISHHSTGTGAVHIGSIESKPTTKRRK